MNKDKRSTIWSRWGGGGLMEESAKIARAKSYKQNVWENGEHVLPKIDQEKSKNSHGNRSSTPPSKWSNGRPWKGWMCTQTHREISGFARLSAVSVRSVKRDQVGYWYFLPMSEKQLRIYFLVSSTIVATKLPQFCEWFMIFSSFKRCSCVISWLLWHNINIYYNILAQWRNKLDQNHQVKP